MKKVIYTACAVVFFTACSLLGVHFKLHNPDRAGKYPEKTETRTLLGNQESKYRTCFDVVAYGLYVKFSKDIEKDKSISGTVHMRALALTGLDTIQLDAHKQLDIQSVTAHSYAKGSPGPASITGANYYRKEHALFVVFPKHVSAGEWMEVDIVYSGIPGTAKRAPWRGGFVEKEDNLDNPWWGVACQSEGASTWWPCKDVVNDEPESVYIELTVPEGLVAVSNGNSKGSTATGEGVRFSWEVSYPINLYNITFYIGKYKLLHDTYKSKVTGDTLALNHYVLEQDYEKAKAHFQQLKGQLAVYEELFGPYPFYRDGFKLVQSPYAGMEHQTAIAYGNKFKNNYLGFDYIILHETAHEWWGNSLTAYDLADGWLHEGFATYSEALYVEKTKGYGEYVNYMRNYRWTIINRRPVVGPYGMRYFNYKDGDIYTKGAWILHTLRETIHDDKVFFDIIKTYATRFAYKNVKSQDFIDVVNEKTKSNYAWFFLQYLDNRFVPEMEYYQDDNIFYYRWNPKYTTYEFPLPVAVSGISLTGNDTLVPRMFIDTISCDRSREVIFKSNILVKFTENQRLKRLMKKETVARSDF
ncbi:MAG TPA: M1 family metallopeptidase [Bacteroidia bacterium]|nr:M1 family metallopeptidase [Bacteroidia bacterium]